MPAPLAYHPPADDPIRVPVAEIETDPARLQFRPHDGPDGLSPDRRDTTPFDADSAPPLGLWLDPDGWRLLAVDGHKRLAAAKQSGASHVLAHLLDAPDADAAREQGRRLNGDDAAPLADRVFAASEPRGEGHVWQGPSGAWYHRGADGADAMFAAGPPRPGLVPQTGDAEHPGHWVLPETAATPAPAGSTSSSLKDAVKAHLEATKTKPLIATVAGVRDAIADAHPGATNDEILATLHALHGEKFVPAGLVTGADRKFKPTEANVPNPAAPDAARPDLSPDERAAAHRYTHSAFGPLNSALRAGEEPGPDVADTHAKLRAVFDRLPDFPEPVRVTRGVNVPEERAAELAAAAKACQESGRPFEMRGFLSTSTGGGAEAFEAGVRFEIEAVRGLDMKPHSEHPNEDEILLDDRSRFEVAGVKTNAAGDVTIRLRQLPGRGDAGARTFAAGAAGHAPHMVGDAAEGAAWLAAMSDARPDRTFAGGVRAGGAAGGWR